MARWRLIKGGEPYAVSDTGLVRGYCGLLTPTQNPKGYLYVSLFGQSNPRRRRAFVHALVLEAFVGRCPRGKQCGHLNGSKTNNRLSNLQWVTPRVNQAHRIKHGTSNRGERNGHAKLTVIDVRSIRRGRAAGATLRALATKYGVCHASICSIMRGENWGWVR